MPPSLGEIWAALASGAVSSVGLVLGAVAGSFCRLSHQKIALAMSVGAGLLLAAASLELAVESIRIAGPVPAVMSLLLGAAVSSAANEAAHPAAENDDPGARRGCAQMLVGHHLTRAAAALP